MNKLKIVDEATRELSYLYQTSIEFIQDPDFEKIAICTYREVPKNGEEIHTVFVNRKDITEIIKYLQGVLDV